MANKKAFAAIALASGALLSGCATTIVPGIGVEQTKNFEDNRDSVVIEAYITDAKTGELKEGTMTIHQDQMPFDGNRVDLPAEESFYKVVADNNDDLEGHRLTVSVSSDSHEDKVTCAIKDTGIFEPVHSAHSEGDGTATCQIEMH